MSAALRWASLTLVAAGVVLVGLLHVVRPDLHPLSDRLSEYARGESGVLMTMAFLAVGGGLAAFGVAVARLGRGDRRSAVLAAIAMLGAAGLAASALFPTGRSPATEQWHTLASGAGVIATVVLLVAWARHPAGRQRFALPLSLLGVGLLVSSPSLHATPVTGLAQRLLWLVVSVGLLRAAWGLPRVEPGNDRTPARVATADAEQLSGGR